MTSKDSIAAIILAAGKGSRMKSALPKVLHKISGVPMINYVLANVGNISPESITIVIGEEMDSVKAVVEGFDKVKCVVQKTRRGSGDAVKQAKSLKNFKGTVLVLFGDTPFITDETMYMMHETLLQNEDMALVVLGFSPEDTAEYGRLNVDSAGKLQAIIEYVDANEDEQAITLCNAGAMAVRGDLLFSMLNKLKPNNAKEEYYLTDLVSIANNDGHSCGVIEAVEEEVLGINTRDQLASAEEIVQDYLRWEAMSGGATLIAPETVFLSHDTCIGQDVTIHPNVVIGSRVVIENGVEIKAFTHLEGVTIKSNTSVGPYARLRPGTTIGEDSKIGNFVEIKNSTLGSGVKAGHLSYIGDSKIGKNVNIGAGTVTCNYDGNDKHQTDIGEDAFVGSNTSLIAPVKIGKKSVVGAGSVITKNVKANSTVVNQVTMKEIKKEK